MRRIVIVGDWVTPIVGTVCAAVVLYGLLRLVLG